MTAAKRLAAAAVMVVVLVGCGEPHRWEERGFDSEEDCWLAHGWDGTVDDGVNDGVNRNSMFNHWCWQIEDG